jgi:glycosyltransferase involved in cell wall biosynthesis
VTTGHALEDDRIFHKEAVSLACKGFEVAVLAPDDMAPFPRSGVTFEAVPIPRGRSRLIRKMVLLSRIGVKSLLMRSHVYHCHEMDAAIAVMPNILFGSKVIYDVHEHFPENYRDRLSRPWLALLNALDRIVARLAHLIITVDEVLAKKYAHSGRIAVVHNYPMLDAFSGADVGRDGTLAIYVGGISEDRGILDLLEALNLARKKNGRLHLKIVGRFTPEDFRRTIDERIAGLSLSGVVEIVEWIPFEEIPKMLRSSGLGLSVLRPVRRYSLAIPIKVYEYMAAGIPVVASDFPILARLLESEKCGMAVKPGSPESISEAMLYLVDNPEKARVMGENGRIAASEKYNWKSESEILVGAYERIARPAGRS